MSPSQSALRSTVSPALLLLRRIRDVMAAPEDVQVRLDKLVSVIAQDFGAQVCSIYLLRAGDVLELFANIGFKPEAVHLTRLQIGEGLVGEIAAQGELLNLAEAQKHPKFAYRPETGEEQYHSFVGVPILSAGKAIGVLVVQSKSMQSFTEDQVEVLQTVAMVLAEINLSEQLVSSSEISRGSSGALVSEHMTGMKLSPGLARAPALLHRPRIEIKKIVADDPTMEITRLQEALSDLQNSVDDLIRQSNLPEGDEQLEIMETYRLFTQDQGWIDQMVNAIRTGLTAEAAVKKVQDQIHSRMSAVSSQYIKERMQDLEDLSNRLIQHLSGERTIPEPADLPPKFILVARAIGPAEILEYGRKRIQGLILEEGSPTSHIAIIARGMDIPVVGRIPNITSLVRNGDEVVADGDAGEVYIRPYGDVSAAVNEHLKQRKKQTRFYDSLRDLPSHTVDDVRISLNINVGLFVDGKPLTDRDVDGIGLYRTEVPYMVSHGMPDVKSQSKIYAKVLRQTEGKRVIFRTFDIGGDKQLPYFPIEREENPAMGWRATRIGLDRPAILRRQLRALLLAAAGRDLDIMFPFIAQLAELEAARELLDKETERARSEGHEMPTSIRVGTMIEVPAILWQLPALLAQVDFVSIGSNDLLQFLYACDRGNQRLAERYDELNPVVFNIVRNIADQCESAKVDLGFCGEMARKPLEAMALIACGVRSLSMPASSVGPIKAMVRTLSCQNATSYMNTLTDLPDASLRTKLVQFARDHGVMI